MEGNTPAVTYEAQLAERASQLLFGIGLEERIELLGVMDEGEMRASLAWLAAQHPQAFDHALVRDEALAGRLLDRLDEAGADEDDPEPYCSACGAPIGIFLGHGPDWHHYRGDGTVESPNELYDAGHEPAVAWRENGRYRCCRHCAHGYTDIPADRHAKPCHEGCNDSDEQQGGAS